MNKRAYEALYLRLKAKALEHQNTVLELLENSNVGPGHTEIIEELEHHLLKLGEYEGAVMLLGNRFQPIITEALKFPAEDQRWAHLLEKIDAIAHHLKPPGASLSKEDLAARSTAFRESAQMAPPVKAADKKSRRKKKKTDKTDE